MTFNKKIVIQKSVEDYDDASNIVEQWTNLYTVWVNVNSLYGVEYWAAAQQGQENTIVFTMRWFNALNSLDLSKMRILFNNVPYNIKSVDNVEFKNRIVKIKAEAVV